MADIAALFPFPLQIFIFAALGLILGSFASALAYRAPRGMSWGFGKAIRSACPECKKPLAPIDLIPIFSWLLLKGKCRHCGVPIPPAYPLIELSSLVMALGIYAAFGFSFVGLVTVLVVPFLVALLAVDLEHMILPDTLVAATFVTGLFYHVASGVSWAAIGGSYLVAGLLYGLMFFVLGWIMEKILKKEALGFGDVKFFAVSGFWLGLTALPALCLLSGIGGVVLGIIWKMVFRQDIFPFGPSLILGFYAVLLLQGIGYL